MSYIVKEPDNYEYYVNKNNDDIYKHIKKNHKKAIKQLKKNWLRVIEGLLFYRQYNICTNQLIKGLTRYYFTINRPSIKKVLMIVQLRKTMNHKV